ncbi:MAG: endonuclease III domain-containing protein [Acidobacteriota bacterium]|nr:endonuclease III domain-containing protein [Acidobacteriota bacterium]
MILSPSRPQLIAILFRRLQATMGPQNWWPAASAFEVILGAYLTQNTAWTNVELAMENLRRAQTLTPQAILQMEISKLEELVRPAGYFRQKAERLKLFAAHLETRHGGSLRRMFAQPTGQLRAELLALKGIGPETADSILLYAAQHEVFVVDTYTRRIFERHGLSRAGDAYEGIRLAVEEAFAAGLGTAEKPGELGVTLEIHPPSAASRLPRSAKSHDYNEFHALLVQTAKHFCLKKEARCEECPLREFLPSGKAKL